MTTSATRSHHLEVQEQTSTPVGLVKPLPSRVFVPHEEDGLVLNAETRWEAMAAAGETTPNPWFFVRNHAATPHVSADSWRLTISGPGVRRSVVVDYATLLSLPAVTVSAVLECAGNGRAFFDEMHARPTAGTPWRLGAVGAATWTGVPLWVLLRRGGLTDDACEVVAEGLDAVRLRRPLSLSKALAGDTLVAYAMNGEPLLPDHGFPARLLVPGWVGVASVKWLGGLHITTRPATTPWNSERYVLTGGSYGRERRPLETQTVTSAVELPWPARLNRGRHQITGRAWSPHGAISAVEISVDAGCSWQPAELIRGHRDCPWTRWRFPIQVTSADMAIRVRARDQYGHTQPETPNWNAQGYLYDAPVDHPVRPRGAS